MPRDTLIDFFRDLSTIRAEFLVYDDGYRRRQHSYEDVARAARGFARRLSAAGLGKDDKVVFWGENRPEWVVCYWGCLISGIVVVPIDYRSSADFVEKVRRLVDARIVLAGDDVPMGGAASTTPGVEWWHFADIDWRADGPMPAVPASRDDVVQIIFTSGATAEPKGVVIRHRNVLANIVPVEREIAKYRGYARPFHPIRFLNLLPLSHMFGQSMATNIPPMVRGTVIFTRSFNPHDLLRSDSRTARVGAGVRAEDPRCPAGARRRTTTRNRPRHPPRAPPFLAAGGVIAGYIPRLASSSGRSSSARRRWHRTSRSSGGAWDSL